MSPDEPFPNFRASRSGDRRTLCSSGSSCDGFWSYKIVKGFVGHRHLASSLNPPYIFFSTGQFLSNFDLLQLQEGCVFITVFRFIFLLLGLGEFLFHFCVFCTPFHVTWEKVRHGVKKKWKCKLPSLVFFKVAFPFFWNWIKFRLLVSLSPLESVETALLASTRPTLSHFWSFKIRCTTSELHRNSRSHDIEALTLRKGRSVKEIGIGCTARPALSQF